MRFNAIGQHASRRGSLGLWLFFCLVLIALAGKGILSALALNRQMVALLHIAMTNEEVFVSPSPMLRTFYKNLEANHARYSDQVGAVLVMLANWLGEPEDAFGWLKIYPHAWERISFPELNWLTLNMLSFDNIKGWNSWRRSASFSAWLEGFRALDQKNYQMAVFWFRRGLVVAPGRVPEDVRLGYYRALSEWYQSSEGKDPRLAKKFGCLADNRPDCTLPSDDAGQGKRLKAWKLPDLGGTEGYLSSNGWQLVGFDLDQDILDAGVEVQGYLHWERTVDGQHTGICGTFCLPQLRSKSWL